MNRFTRAAVFAVPFAALLFSSGAHATPRPLPGAPEIAGRPATPPPSIVFESRAEALAQLTKIVAWDKTMQSVACIDPDAGIDAGQNQCTRGGIIEVESGPANAIIESDNTQEGVFNWSFHRTLTMDATYAPQVGNAFDYLSTHPGWLEYRDGSDPGPADSYSIYNCGWGVRAVIQYEAATGDMSHHAYGDMCASHLHDYAGVLANDTLINAATSAWAAAGLYQWGVATSQAAMTTRASAIGAEAKAWIDASPARVASRTWAVTGGAVFYGVVGSYMQDHPGELAGWLPTVTPLLAGYVDSSQPIAPNDWTDWRNAHSAWNMLAQFTAADAIGGADGDTHRQIALDILTKLIAQDTDMDGAIPGSQQRPATEDESWITAYLVYFGLRFVITEPIGDDAGVADGGTADDASASDDAGTSSDGGGNGATGGSSDSGCGCSVAGVDGSAWGGIGAALALAAAATRRRRRA
jgi:MYXO-CTERM domain-containing protein